MNRMRTRYRAMNCSIECTELLTSLSMVMYWDNNFVHAGEYLFHALLALAADRRAMRWYSLGGGDRVAYVCPFKIVQGYDDAE